MFYLVVSIWWITTTITGINALTFITGEMLATNCFIRKVAQLSCNLIGVNLHIFTVKAAQLPPLLVSTFCLLVSSADNVCTQFGIRSSLTKRRAWSGSNLVDTEMVFLEEYLKIGRFWKKSADDKKHAKLSPRGQRVNLRLFSQCTHEVGNYRIYMCEDTFKACMRSYLVG